MITMKTIKDKTFEALQLLSVARAPVILVDDSTIHAGFEKDMKGVIVACDHYDLEPLFVLDASSEFEHNKSVAKPSYFDSDHQPTKTVFEANLYKSVDAIFPDQTAPCPVKSEDPRIQAVIDLIQNDDTKYVNGIQAVLELNGIKIVPFAAGKEGFTTETLESEVSAIPAGNVVMVKTPPEEDQEEFMDVFYELVPTDIKNKLCESPFDRPEALRTPGSVFMEDKDIENKLILYTDEIREAFKTPEAFRALVENAGSLLLKNLEKVVEQAKTPSPGL